MSGSQPAPDSSELDALLHALCEGQLDKKSHDRLHELIAADDASLQRYIEVMHLSTELVDWACRESNVTALEKQLENLQGMLAEKSRLESVERLAESKSQAGSVLPKHVSESAGWSRRLKWFSALAACLVALAAFPLFWGDEPGKPARDSDSTPLVAGTGEPLVRPVATPVFVAHVVEVTGDVTWAQKSAPHDLMLRVGADEQISIKSGVLRLQYYSGAEVILHGPAIFMPTGMASGHLAAGSMVGKVSDSEIKEFRLTTPGAEVVDLGTVFGVAVGDSDQTDVCVFDGEVEVSSLNTRAETQEPIRLLEGMSVRLSSDGIADLSAHVDRKQFLNKLPPQLNPRLAANEISLIDAFIDGPGLSHRLVATLDPLTGKPDGNPVFWFREHDGVGYRRAVYSEFVDGVSVTPRSTGSVQIDSYGNSVELPFSTGRSYGTVWARRPVPGVSLMASLSEEGTKEVWEIGATRKSFKRLEHCRLGMIGLHANVVLTFDLFAMQSVEGQQAERFRCAIANLGGPQYWRGASESYEYGGEMQVGPSGVANVRVFVDGVECAQISHLRPDLEEQLLEVNIDAFSKVLTIVVTGISEQDGYEQVVLIDPTVELAY